MPADIATGTVGGVGAIEMRDAVGRFATGVTVVTTVTPSGAAAGCAVSAFSSLSLDPPLVLVCIGKRRRMHRLLTTAPGYAVNVLSAGQDELALAFARPGAHRFSGVGHRSGRHGIPLLTGALAHIECDRHAVVGGGDHVIVVGRVRRLAVADGEPLLYFQGGFLHPPAQDARNAAHDDTAHRWLLSAPW